LRRRLREGCKEANMVGPFPDELLPKKHPGWRIIRGDLFSAGRGQEWPFRGGQRR
jgi:hypothetical protein